MNTAPHAVESTFRLNDWEPEKKRRKCIACNRRYTTYNPERCNRCWARWNISEYEQEQLMISGDLAHPDDAKRRVGVTASPDSKRVSRARDNLESYYAEAVQPYSLRRLIGVCMKRPGSWAATFRRRGRAFHIGTYATKQDASEAWAAWVIKIRNEVQGANRDAGKG